MLTIEKLRLKAIEELTQAYEIHYAFAKNKSQTMTPNAFYKELLKNSENMDNDTFNLYMDGVAKTLLGFSFDVASCQEVSYEDCIGLLKVCKEAGIEF